MNCEFSSKHYKEILENLHDVGTVSDKKNIILRHDVDFSIQSAVALAEIEHDEQIYSTYFILFHSTFYNACNEIETIKTIKRLGHEIGLHVDYTFNTGYEEAEFLSKIINENIKWCCAHRPNALGMPKKIMMGDVSKLENYHYISDSCRWWREGCVCKHLNENKLYINIHPEWWINSNMNRFEVITKIETQTHSRLEASALSVKEFLFQHMVRNKHD